MLSPPQPTLHHRLSTYPGKVVLHLRRHRIQFPHNPFQEESHVINLLQASIYPHLRVASPLFADAFRLCLLLSTLSHQPTSQSQSLLMSPLVKSYRIPYLGGPHLPTLAPPTGLNHAKRCTPTIAKRTCLDVALSSVRQRRLPSRPS
jgi:hypothetical protein